MSTDIYQGHLFMKRDLGVNKYGLKVFVWFVYYDGECLGSFAMLRDAKKAYEQEYHKRNPQVSMPRGSFGK